MIELPCGLVVAEHAGAGRWVIYAGRVRRHRVDSADAAEKRDAMALADRLAEEYGGVAVRCIVLITERSGDLEPQMVAAYPRHVHVITRNLALAQAVCCAAPRFVLIRNGGVLSASLFVRTRGGLCEQPIRTTTIDRLRDIADDFGVDHFALEAWSSLAGRELRMVLSPSATVEVLPLEAHIAGAVSFASTLANRDGVWQESAAASRLNATRSISYGIHRTSRPVFDVAECALADVVRGKPVLLAIDQHVNAIYGDAMQEYARRRLNTRGTVILSPLESDKNWWQVERICQAAIDLGLDRRGIVVGVGGGVTLDIAGMAAAVFRRGVGYVRVPTTLVGLIDVSLGLKQAVNACDRKNLVGAFHAPVGGVNDYNFLRTLPSHEVSCGLAEVVKIALVRDASLFNDVERLGPLLVTEPATRTSRAARDIWYRAECLMLEELSSNLFEASLERLVDFGHTFSPTIETASNYQIAHGQAVALDMLLSTAIAVEHGICEEALFIRLAELLRALGLPVWSPELTAIERLQGAIASASLHRGGNPNLVVPVTEGSPTLVQAVTDRVLASCVDVMRSVAGDRQLAATDAGAA